MIVVFGTVCIDRIRGIQSLPPLGGYVPITFEKFVLGGEAINTYSHLRRWGAECQLIGNPPADDEEGVCLRRLLTEANLSIESNDVSPESTPVCDIYVTPDGERTMFGRGFDKMTAAPASSFQPVGGGWLTSDANLRPLADDYARAAKVGGMHVYLMDFREPGDLLGPGDVWQGSTDWIGEHGDAHANTDQLRTIVETTGCYGILTDGPNGFVAGSAQSGIKSYNAIPIESSRDSTGAGDTFRAGMLFGLDQAWPIEKCLHFASAAAALSTQHQGGANGPTREEIEALRSPPLPPGEGL